MNADGTEQTDVTTNEVNESNAAWSPDGIAARLHLEPGRQRRDLSGERGRLRNRTRLTNNPAEDHDPDWSPDGEKLAFYSDRPGSSCCGTVWTINASDGSGATNLTNGSIFDADPAWSPDGSRIAFVRDAGGQNFQVWTALADGTEQVLLTPIGGRNSFPDWGRPRRR